MSTAASTVSTALSSAVKRSIGDVCIELHDISIISGDTGATATGKSLHRVDYAILIADVLQTAVPTYSGNVATFTFNDPVATVKGQIILFGR